MRNLCSLILFGLMACSSAEKTDPAYVQAIQQHRNIITYQFLDKNSSPLKPENILNFKGLPYFDVDGKYKITATFQPNLQLTAFAMPHTQGRSYNYALAGTLNFELNGKALSLNAFVSTDRPFADSMDVVIPFTDLTSGKATYGGGRLLDVRLTPNQQQVTLDFNLAYNPYCAYNSEFSCPIPPKENNLAIAIEAGEQYQATTH